MIRYGKSIRLTPLESRQLERITGFAPVGIKSEEDLHVFIQKCKSYYEGGVDTPELHRLIDAVAEKTLAGHCAR